ncbi:Uma2 family endonuclease [Myxococcota bacterium]
MVPEPGIELERAPEVSPDLAGWQRENLPMLPPEGEAFRTVSDWVCQVLSTGNARYDQQTKAPFYASVGVPWLWMVDTRSRLIEVRRLCRDKWLVEAVFSEEREARMSPFEAIAIPLHRLWV